MVPLAAPRIPSPAAAAAAAANAACVPGAFENLWAPAPNNPKPPRFAGGGVIEPAVAAPEIIMILG